MLYNPKWNKQDIWSVENLIAWLETKSGPYEYVSPRNCLLGQYFTAMGMTNVVVGTREVNSGKDKEQPFPWEFNRIAHYQTETWTFEGALAYARQLVNR
jgi:hypothetical protein